MSDPLGDYQKRESYLLGKLGDAINAIRREQGTQQDRAFAVESALNAWVGLQRDYGTLGEIHRMQMLTLAITMAGGGEPWRKLLPTARSRWLREAEAAGQFGGLAKHLEDLT